MHITMSYVNYTWENPHMLNAGVAYDITSVDVLNPTLLDGTVQHYAHVGRTWYVRPSHE